MNDLEINFDFENDQLILDVKNKVIMKFSYEEAKKIVNELEKLIYDEPTYEELEQKCSFQRIEIKELQDRLGVSY